MTGRLDARVALVTGSGRGIGLAVAEKLAGEGAAVVVNDIDEDVAHGAAEAIGRAGGRAAVCAGDVTAPGFGERMVETAVSGFGRVDIIVTNAGWTWDATIQNTADEQFQAMLDVHLVAPFRLLRAAQPHLRRQHRDDVAAGRRVVRKVVTISSLAGVGGGAGQVGYATAKAGVSGLTKSLAKEWGRYDVTVNAVAFGLVDTRLTAPLTPESLITVGSRQVRVGVSEGVKRASEEQVPLGRSGSVSDAAGAVALLTYPESDYVSGQVLLCAGGYVI